MVRRSFFHSTPTHNTNDQAARSTISHGPVSHGPVSHGHGHGLPYFQNAPAPSPRARNGPPRITKQSAPPRLSPLIIPVQASARPVRVVPTAQEQYHSARADFEDATEMDFFQFQHPCMLPPATITLTHATVTPAAATKASSSSPRYSLPVLPSQGSKLQRSKPYLQSRRQRMPTRNSVRLPRQSSPPSPTTTTATTTATTQGEGDDGMGGETTPVMRAAVAVPLRRMALEDVAKDHWYGVVETIHSQDDTAATPVARQETPLEYRARQAAALHDLLGLILGDESVGGYKEGGGTVLDVAILEESESEEEELAAKGFRKISADEYLSEVRDVWWQFES